MLYKFSPFILSFIILILSSCEKAPINGDLDGQWQVVSVDPKPPAILSERLYYNFSLHVCQLTYYEGYFMSGNLKFDGMVVEIDFPFVESERDVLILHQYGIYDNPVRLTVESLNAKQLILSDAVHRIVLRKF